MTTHDPADCHDCADETIAELRRELDCERARSAALEARLAALSAEPTMAALLDEARRLDAAATPGPWIGDWAASGPFGDPVSYFPVSTAHVNGYPQPDNGLIAACCNVGLVLNGSEGSRNAAFIARARTLLPALVAAASARLAKTAAEVVAVEEERDEARRELADFLEGNRMLRQRHGAQGGEDFPMFVSRLVRERDAALSRATAAEAELAGDRVIMDTLNASRESLTTRLLAAEALADGLGEALETVPAGVKFGPWWAKVGQPASDKWRKARGR